MHRIARLILATAIPLGALSIPAAVGTSHSEPAPFQDATPTPDAPEGWTRVVVTNALEAFSIALPPGWEYRPLRGIDSYVGEFVGDGIRLGFDYGMYSNRLAEPGDPGYEVTWGRLDCKDAKFVVAEESPARHTGVYVPHVNPSAYTREGTVREFRDALQVSGSDVTTEQRPLVLGILRSIRFEPFCVRGETGDWEIFDSPFARSQGDYYYFLPIDVAMLSSTRGWSVGERLLYDVDQDHVRRGCAIARLEGELWYDVTCPGQDHLASIAMLSEEEGWAVGGHSILHYAQGAWSVYSDTVEATLTDVSIWDDGHGLIVGPDLVLRLEGDDWLPLSTEHGGQAVDMVGPDRAYVADHRQLHVLEGDRWRSIPWTLPDDPDHWTSAIEVLEDEQIWTVGGLVDRSDGLVISRTAGAEPVASWLDEAGRLFDVDVLTGAAAEGPVEVDAWAVGGFVDGSGAAGIYRVHPDGIEVLETPFRGLLQGIDMLSPAEGWAVGTRFDADGDLDGGVFLRYREHLEVTSPTSTPPPSPSPSPTPTLTPGPDLGPTLFLPRLDLP